jgi:hypothetical protein
MRNRIAIAALSFIVIASATSGTARAAQPPITGPQPTYYQVVVDVLTAIVSGLPA